MRVLPRQAIAGGKVADLRAQIALLALEAALGALLGYQFDEKALDQRGERSVPLCSLSPGSPVGLVLRWLRQLLTPTDFSKGTKFGERLRGEFTATSGWWEDLIDQLIVFSFEWIDERDAL